MLWGITIRFQKLFLSWRQVAHVLLTRPPLRISVNQNSPFDLHVLSVPPAFVLSQDQTLYKSCISRIMRFFEILFNNACVITAFFSLCLTFPVKEFQGSLLIFSIVQFSRCCRRYFRLIHYITFSSFCQVFSEDFFKKLFFCDRHSEKRLNYYITTCPVCQELFSNFFQNFSDCDCRLWDSLFIISLPDGFVKSFSKLFSEKLL